MCKTHEVIPRSGGRPQQESVPGLGTALLGSSGPAAGPAGESSGGDQRLRANARGGEIRGDGLV